MNANFPKFFVYWFKIDYPVGSKELRILNFLPLVPAKFFRNMAATAGTTCRETDMKILKTRIIVFLWSSSRNNWMQTDRIV